MLVRVLSAAGTGRPEEGPGCARFPCIPLASWVESVGPEMPSQCSRAPHLAPSSCW